MPLIVGIRDEKKREVFTDEEGSFLASFNMGMIAMSAGIGSIKKNEQDYGISVDVATDRFNLVWDRIGKSDSPFTKEFVQKMADADWESNVGNMSDEQFAWEQKEIMFNDAVSKYDNIKAPDRISWSDKKAQDGLVKNFVGIYLSGETHYYDDFTKSMVDEFAMTFNVTYDKPIYHDSNSTPLYLRYDESGDVYFLSDEKQEVW